MGGGAVLGAFPAGAGEEAEDEEDGAANGPQVDAALALLPGGDGAELDPARRVLNAAWHVVEAPWSSILQEYRANDRPQGGEQSVLGVLLAAQRCATNWRTTSP